METSTASATNLEVVTDLVMKRQLVEVPRDHIKDIVKMVMECADEAAGPAHQPKVRRINATIRHISCEPVGHGYCDRVSYVTSGDGDAVHGGSAFTPPSDSLEPTVMSTALSRLLGHNVALWVTDDEFFHMPTIVQFNDLGKPE
ncbi:hypothetical protein Achl_4351 (plasmid) [Pseudarthrobacter chlorophenolicus A6]|uniref:Uncharacterized protein n=1 Tax=Pseudarthrobacter chlorophenolicus (strain ATCC 700700 / DSM 12829 / CIP 107037 / JCM 12360 / KCTC 9906 / NCIMB 13794 / A6) TaxID=452863 RepID=B8HIQ5_PSECP|nr:hypothetical protein [Pseudarthrobacter chlorophenolicus]ACL42302.1 hypothetical protein Achl_4351 [Pseudarthrobacter chlorophenolicus A6]